MKLAQRSKKAYSSNVEILDSKEVDYLNSRKVRNNMNTNKVLLMTLSWFFTALPMNLAVESTVQSIESNEQTIKLIMGKEENLQEESSFEVSLQHAKLLRGILWLLEENHIVIDVPQVHFSIGKFLIKQLGRVEKITQNELLVDELTQSSKIDPVRENARTLQKIAQLRSDSETVKEEIRKELEQLEGDTVVAILLAAEYLDIPFVPELAQTCVMDMGVQAFTAELIAAIPNRLRAALLENYILRVLGKHVLCKTQSEITCLAAGPDGTIAVGLASGNIHMYSPEGKEFAVCKSNGKTFVSSLCMTADCDIVAGYSDGTICIWNTIGTQLAIHTPTEGAREEVFSLKVTLDGKIVSAHLGGIDIYDRQCRKISTCALHFPCSVFVMPDGTILTGSFDGTSHILDTVGNLQALPFERERGVSMSSIFLGSSMNRVVTGSFLSVSATPSGEIVSLSWDGNTRVQDALGKELIVFKAHKNMEPMFTRSRTIPSICVTADGKIITASSKEGVIRVWSKNGEELAESQIHESGVSALCMKPDDQIVIGDFNNTVRVRDLGVLEMIKRIHIEDVPTIWKFLQSEYQLQEQQMSSSSSRAFLRIAWEGLVFSVLDTIQDDIFMLSSPKKAANEAFQNCWDKLRALIYPEETQRNDGSVVSSTAVEDRDDEDDDEPNSGKPSQKSKVE